MTRYLLLLLVALSVACHKDTSVGPANLLFQRWQLLQSKRIGDTAWVVHDTDGVYDTEYRQNGALVYRRDGVVLPQQCCAPTHFRGKGKEITYTTVTSCPYALCAGTILPATIQKLTPDLLELNDGIYIMQYQSVQ
ncbi:hypothetical protein [Spirosoma sp. KUDC1026]|uniref:hypothetical protein n=1 Tax=Spirosoma sp. KUDC1026 TaxID=2745947 RepID=UPI00159B882E|nr:hypothetical protein [Spirosoma sp. KUDC1026]QKZ11163.1 hypothetical protein HU175_00305 [Spirosoma sp. KUDC1026]